MSARSILFLAGLLAFVPSSAQAIELKNIRPSYGPFGATRADSKFLPGDYLFVSYDIDGLKLDDKNRANYVILLEVFDSANKTIFKKETPNVAIPQLGGGRIPGDLHVIMGVEQTPGQYKVRLTVKDSLSGDIKSFIHPFELLPRGFGIVGVGNMPAVIFPSQPCVLQCMIVELALDAAKKPNAKVEIKILDESGKAVSPPIVNNYPADLADNVDLKKGNFIPIDLPIFPNRPGRFVIEITASDLAGRKTATVRYPVTVLDLAAAAASGQ